MATTLTATAAERLHDELTHIREVQLPAAREAIAESKSAGDNSENNDFFVALDDEAQLLARVAQIEATLRDAEIVESVSTSNVGPGTVVSLDFGDGDVEKMFVGSIEESKVSEHPVLTVTSPLGAAVLGAAVGEVVSYESPAGAMSVTVVAIEAP